MIAGVCVPIMCTRGTTETCEKELLTCSAREGCYCGGRTSPAAACRWLASEAAPPVVREMLAITVVESIKRGGGGEKVGYKEERKRRVLTTEDSDTRLRIIKRLNLLVSQPFLYIYIYTHTQGNIQ